MKKSKTAVRSYNNVPLSAEEIAQGYCIRPMDPMANMVTSEHNTGFYETVERTDKLTGKTVEGFVERNNYLDRL